MSSITSEPFAPTMEVTTITGNPDISSSIFHVRGASLGRPRVTTLGATGTVSAGALVNGFLKLAPTANPSTYTLPTAAQIVAAWISYGCPLKVGDVFEVRFQGTVAVNAAAFAMGANLTAANSLENPPARTSGVLTFRATNVSSATEAFTVALSVSA